MNQKLRILIVEDNPADADFIHEMLPQAGSLQFQIESAQRLSEALARLKRRDVDLVLLDLGLPDSQGLQTFYTLQKAAPDIPVIVMTGNDDQEMATAAVRDGAQDYLVKGQISGRPLIRAVRHALARQKAEEALRASEEKYRVLFSEMLDGFALHEIICDAHGKPSDYRFLAINPAFERMTGLKARDIVGRTVLEVMPDTERHWIDTYGKVALTGEPAFFQNYSAALRKHFEVMTFRPAPNQFACVVADITERKLAGEKLQLRESFLSAITENQPGLLWLKDAEGRFLTVNKAFAKACNRGEPENVRGLTDLDIWPKELAEKYRADDRRVMASGNACMVEEMIAVGSSHVWHETFKTPVRDDKGRVIGTTGYSRDITERKRSEMELRAKEEKYRQLFDASPDGVIQIGTDERIVRANVAMARMYGYDSPDDLIGFYPPNFVAPASREFSEQILRRRLNGEDIKQVEYELIRKDGTTFYGETLATILRNEDGAVTGYICITRDTTERRRVEQAMRESQAFYHSLVEQLPAGVFRKNQDGRYVFVSSGFCRLKNMKAEDFLGKTAQEVAVGAAAQRDPAGQAVKYATTGEGHHQMIMRTGKPVELVEEYAAADGRKQFVHAIKIPVFNPDGQIIGTQGILFDVTAQKQAEADLNRERDLWRSLLDTSPDKIYFKDTQSRFIKASKALASQFGLASPDEMLGRTDFDFFDEAHARPAFEDEQEIIRTGRPMIAKEELEVWKDGRISWTSSTKMPLRDGAGKIIGIMGISRDITERKRVEEEIERTAREWQNTFDATKDAIWILDKDHRILRTNKAAEKFFKRPCCEMMGKPCWEIVHGTTEPVPNCPYVRSRKSRQRETMELQQDGHWFEVIVDPIIDAAGQYVGAVHIVSDITEQRKLEAQFRQAQKMEAIGTLASGVAHDFNNILGVVLGYADLILVSLEPDSPLQIYAEEIRHAAEHATSLTRQLLIFSRKQKVEPVVLDLNDTVKDLEKMLRRLIGENIEMTVVPGKEIGRIRADAGHIGQVLMNLAVNARDAMPNGGKLAIATSNVTLGENDTTPHESPGSAGVSPASRAPETGTRRRDASAPRSYVLLTVSDTGTGMTPEVKARMFEALFTTKPVGKGTGLGLATCQTIVQQSGGHIEVDSEVGKGTTFRIYFPRVDRPVDAAAGPDEAGPIPHGTETVLLVEDELPVRQLAWHLLESLGYQVLGANNGQEALQLIQKYQGPPIRLAITDVVMPRMGGKAMADWLKTNHPGIKILFTSGYTDDALAKQDALEPGVAFLAKPYTSAALAFKVRAILDDETDTSLLRKMKMTGNQSQ